MYLEIDGLLYSPEDIRTMEYNNNMFEIFFINNGNNPQKTRLEMDEGKRILSALVGDQFHRFVLIQNKLYNVKNIEDLEVANNNHTVIYFKDGTKELVYGKDSYKLIKDAINVYRNQELDF